MATAADLIKSSLRRITAYQSGEPLQQPDAQDCLDTLNDMLDSWSIDKQLIFGSVENILTLNAGQSQYKIGNPTNTSLGLPPFLGTIGASFNGQTATNVLTVNSITSGVFNVGDTIFNGVTSLGTIVTFGSGTGGTGTYNLSTSPGTIAATAMTSQSFFIAQIVGLPSNVLVGATVTDLQALIPASTLLTAVGTTTVTMSAQAGPTSSLDNITYTIPGDFAIPRPNRITHGFTRFSQLDFSIEVTMSQSRFVEILYKAQPGPWPTVAWYNPQEPYGLINFYQTPGNSAQLHLFTDTILSNLTINQTFVLPSGYARAIKWNLAKEIWVEYWGDSPIPDAIKTHAADSMAMIKALNATPAVKAKYDAMLINNGRVGANWILTGGYG